MDEQKLPQPESSILQGSVDSDWAGDSNHRRSITAYALEMAGSTVYYKTKFQDTIATSSSGAECTAACEAAKSICYVRSILDEIGVPQDFATALFIDNQGALLMADTKQPTKNAAYGHQTLQNSRVGKMQYCEHAKSHDQSNVSDAPTKSLHTNLFHRHMDRIMGNRIPSYVNHFKENL